MKNIAKCVDKNLLNQKECKYLYLSNTFLPIVALILY